MKRVIFKYVFTEDDGPLSIPWSSSSRVILVAAQPSSATVPTLWVNQPGDDFDEDGETTLPGRMFALCPTGWAFTQEPGEEHIGSAVCADGLFVCHVMAEGAS